MTRRFIIFGLVGRLNTKAGRSALLIAPFEVTGSTPNGGMTATIRAVLIKGFGFGFGF